MAASGYTPISLYYTTSSGSAPTSGNLVNGELALNINDADVALYTKNASGTVKRIMNNPASLKYPTADGTNGQILITNGSGVLSFSSITSGATLSNDTSTATQLYPMFAAATSGTPTTVYTSNSKLLYQPSTGDFTAYQLNASNGLHLNATTLIASYTIPSGSNALTVGPFTVPSGLAVTITSGQRWVVL
jgi:hypothetical protein